jgi:phage gp36-like protein
MSYILRADIEAEAPTAVLAQALDDDGDGFEDLGLFDKIAERASSDVDGILGQRFEVPFLSPVPPIVSRAARIFFLAAMYRRRQVREEDNPYAAQEREMAAKLGRIATGDEPLSPGSVQGEAILSSEDSRTHDDGGRISL